VPELAQVLRFEGSPDLRPLFLKAVVNGRFASTSVPDTVAERVGVPIDLDHVVDYARVCGFHVGGTLPLTYVHVLAFPLQVALMARRDFPVPLVGLVHVENTIRWTRPVAPTDVLDLRVAATTMRPHRRGRIVDLVSEVTVAGERVWTGVSTYLARGTGDASAPTSEAPDTSALAGLPGGSTWRLPKDTGRRYAAVSGDVNPIHLHSLSARALGFPTAIAHGMFTYAKVIAALGPKVPQAGESHVWFKAPVTLPSTVLLKVSADGQTALVRPAKRDGEHLIVRNTAS